MGTAFQPLDTSDTIHLAMSIFLETLVGPGESAHAGDHPD